MQPLLGALLASPHMTAVCMHAPTVSLAHSHNEVPHAAPQLLRRAAGCQELRRNV